MQEFSGSWQRVPSLGNDTDTDVLGTALYGAASWVEIPGFEGLLQALGAAAQQEKSRRHAWGAASPCSPAEDLRHGICHFTYLYPERHSSFREEEIVFSVSCKL